MLDGMATISFARGAPSLDIVDVEGLQEAAQRAFADDPAGTTAYGTSVGYVPLREWIAARLSATGARIEPVVAPLRERAFDAELAYWCERVESREGR